MSGPFKAVCLLEVKVMEVNEDGTVRGECSRAELDEHGIKPKLVVSAFGANKLECLTALRASLDKFEWQNR